MKEVVQGWTGDLTTTAEQAALMLALMK